MFILNLQMKLFLPVAFVYFLQTSLLEGFTVRFDNNKMRENTSIVEMPIKSFSRCSENCTFVITSNSLISAQESFQKFMKLKKAMLLYLNINTINFTLQPEDQKQQNQFLEWQWAPTENFWYLGLPIDLDYSSFHLTYVGESRIRLDIKTLNADCCFINEVGIEQIRNILWSDVFSNKSESLLCNRYFQKQEWKKTFFYITTVWIGYDLFCKAPDVDKAYSEKTKASATLLIPMICFYISLYYPLVNKIIESKTMRNHLKRIKQNLSDGMEFTDYVEGDSPFGYRRMVLKYFFVSKLKANDKTGISKFLPMHRLNFIFCFVFITYVILPMILEINKDIEELEDFNTIYKLGFPVFNFTEQKRKSYRPQLIISLCLVPFICVANFWSYKCLSESSDFLIYLKWKSKCKCCSSLAITEDVEDIINNIKGSIEKSNPNNGVKTEKNQSTEAPKEDEGNIHDIHAKKMIEFIDKFETLHYYSKFIKRFNLLLSKDFWVHVWTQSTDLPNVCSCFCKRCNCKVCKKDNNKYSSRSIVGISILFPLNCIVIFMTCAFPSLWLMVFTLSFRLRDVFSSENDKKGSSATSQDETEHEIQNGRPPYVSNEIDSSKDEEDPLLTSTQQSSKSCNKNNALICFILVDLPVVILLYLQLSIVVLIVRSAMYTILIVVTNYDHLTRIVIAVISCAGYLGTFLNRFMDKYATILKTIFDQKEFEQPNRTDYNTNAKDETQTKNTSSVETKMFVTEECFHYVIDHSLSVREEYFFVLFKSIVTILFFIASMGILLDSNLLDTSSKLTNIFELIMIIVAPHIVLKCFENDSKQNVNEHKRDIEAHIDQFHILNPTSKKDQNRNNYKNKCYKCYQCINLCDTLIGSLKSVPYVVCCCDPQCEKEDESIENNIDDAREKDTGKEETEVKKKIGEEEMEGHFKRLGMEYGINGSSESSTLNTTSTEINENTYTRMVRVEVQSSNTMKQTNFKTIVSYKNVKTDETKVVKIPEIKTNSVTDIGTVVSVTNVTIGNTNVETVVFHKNDRDEDHENTNAIVFEEPTIESSGETDKETTFDSANESFTDIQDGETAVFHKNDRDDDPENTNPKTVEELTNESSGETCREKTFDSENEPFTDMQDEETVVVHKNDRDEDSENTYSKTHEELINESNGETDRGTTFESYTNNQDVGWMNKCLIQ